jgi:hypothetical protein
VCSGEKIQNAQVDHFVAQSRRLFANLRNRVFDAANSSVAAGSHGSAGMNGRCVNGDKMCIQQWISGVKRTLAQQIVYAESLTISGGSNARDGTELRQKGVAVAFSADMVTGPVTPLSAFHFSICSGMYGARLDEARKPKIDHFLRG